MVYLCDCFEIGNLVSRVLTNEAIPTLIYCWVTFWSHWWKKVRVFSLVTFTRMPFLSSCHYLMQIELQWSQTRFSNSKVRLLGFQLQQSLVHKWRRLLSAVKLQSIAIALYPGWSVGDLVHWSVLSQYMQSSFQTDDSIVNLKLSCT